MASWSTYWRAALIVCMEDMQVTQVQTMVDDPSKVVLMGDGIPDPIGAGPELYEKTAALIESHIPALVDRLLASEEAAS